MKPPVSFSLLEPSRPTGTSTSKYACAAPKSLGSVTWTLPRRSSPHHNWLETKAARWLRTPAGVRGGVVWALSGLSWRDLEHATAASNEESPGGVAMFGARNACPSKSSLVQACFTQPGRIPHANVAGLLLARCVCLVEFAGVTCSFLSICGLAAAHVPLSGVSTSNPGLSTSCLADGTWHNRGSSATTACYLRRP